MGDVISLNRVRKARARATAAADAQANRVRFGRTKAEKAADAAERTRAERSLDDARRKGSAPAPDGTLSD